MFFVPVLDRQFGIAVETVVIKTNLRFDPARFVAQQQMHARRRLGQLRIDHRGKRVHPDRQARKAGIVFTKEGNCFTTISDAAGLAKIADTLSDHRAIGRLSQVCERWIYTCVCFALDFDEQKRSGFRYQYSNYQIEYSRNLVFEVGGHMDQVFQALIDRSRAPLDLKTIRTIFGYRHRPIYRRRTKRSAECEVAVERPTYDLTIFKLHCGKLERFAEALSCIDQCFIA